MKYNDWFHLQCHKGILKMALGEVQDEGLKQDALRRLDDLCSGIKKTMPKKPIYTYIPEVKRGVMDCDPEERSVTCPNPNCDCDLGEVIDAVGHPSYCPWCGQELDWSIDDDN